MNRTSKVHWGEWVIQRSMFLRFRSQSELAEAVGCRSEQVSRWAQMKEPPRQMRKGFDRSLAVALKVDREILFRGYADVSPADVADAQKFESTRNRLLAVIELMPPEGLKELAQVGERLLGASLRVA